jgi:excisionase family DNA binding protein
MSAAIEIIELEPLAPSPAVAARYLSISKRSISRLIAKKRFEARKAGPRRLVDVVSLNAYCESPQKKTDYLPIVFDRRAHAVLRPLSQIHH